MVSRNACVCAPMVSSQWPLLLRPPMQAQLPALLRDHVTASDARSMNSMLAGKVLADAVQRHSQRIVDQFAAEIKAGRDHPALVTLRREDFGIVPPGAEGAGGRDNDMPHTVLKDLDLVIGLRKVKQHIRALHATTLVNSARRAVGLGLGSKQASKSLHMVFKVNAVKHSHTEPRFNQHAVAAQGNPGTGKSTMAKIIGACRRAIVAVGGQCMTCLTLQLNLYAVLTARLLKGMGLLKHGQVRRVLQNAA